MGVRVTGVSVLFNSINVGKILQTLPKVTLFCSGICVGEPAARVTGISAILRGFNVEKNPRMLAKVAAVENEFVEETVARVTAILRGFNVEKNPRMLLKIGVVNNRFGNEFNKGGEGKWVCE